jgi:hypothetical protein
MPQHHRSPMKQHPGGWQVLDYRAWAESTSAATNSSEDSPLGTSGLTDRRFNDDPVEFYGRMAVDRATKGDYHESTLSDGTLLKRKKITEDDWQSFPIEDPTFPKDINWNHKAV